MSYRTGRLVAATTAAILKMLGSVLSLAVVAATLLTLVCANVMEVVVYVLPASYWFEVEDVYIPDIDLSKPMEVQFVVLKRTVKAGPMVAKTNSEFVLSNAAGNEFCRMSGEGLYGPAANGLPVRIPFGAYLPPSCTLPAGCYYQDRHYEFEVFGVRKAVDHRSNSFSVSDERTTGICREEDA